MEGGSSPSCHREKRSKKTQDHAAVPKPPGRTKASYSHGGAGGSRAARGHGVQGSSAVIPPPALAFVGDMPIVDEAEEALDRAGRTIATPPIHTPTRGPASVSQLVPFTDVSPIMREPTMALNPAGGWTPLPVDYHHRVKDIRYNRNRNLYAEDEKDLRLEYRFWHPFHYDFYDSILYQKFLKKKEPPVLQMKCIDAYSLGKFKEPELVQMVRDIQSMGLSYLLEF